MTTVEVNSIGFVEGVVVGIFIGLNLGFIVLSLLVASKQGDEVKCIHNLMNKGQDNDIT